MESTDQWLRGLGQVVFCNNAFSGALILGGLGYADPGLAALALLGCASATTTAKLAGADKDAIAAGLTGYNGALVGCAFSVFLGAPSLEPAAVATVLGGAASALLWTRLGPLTSPVPQWTLAFNVTALSVLAYVKPLAAGAPAVAAGAPLAASALSALELGRASLVGISQIFVVNDPVAGALILSGIACYSRWAAGATLAGSLVGVGTAIAVGADAAPVADGLWGFNPALTALAVSIFFVPTGTPMVALAVGGAAGTALLAAVMGNVMGSAFSVPSLTLPFCAAASCCYLLGARGARPNLMLAKTPHSPEVNLQAFRAAQG